MPAYFDTGFSVRQVPWHGMGMIADEYPESWEQAREWAGLTWEPEIRDLYLHLPSLDGIDADLGNAVESVFADGDAHEASGEIDGRAVEMNRSRTLYLPDHSRMVPVPSHRLVVRPDNDRVLGVVSDKFSLISHAAMGEIIETVLGQPNVKFETAGSVKGGATVWALAYIDEPYRIAGDDSETFPFLAVLNHHDGSGACKIVATQVRVVCWNTVQAASMEGERTGRQYVIRHVGDVASRLEEVKAALAGVKDEASAWSELAEALFGMPVTDLHLNQYISEFIPMPEADTISDRVRANIEGARSKFRSIYLDSVTCEAHRGTALGLVDAATEYLDHVRGFRSRDTYLGRTMLRPEPMKARAVNIVRRVCV